MTFQSVSGQIYLFMTHPFTNRVKLRQCSGRDLYQCLVLCCYSSAYFLTQNADWSGHRFGISDLWRFSLEHDADSCCTWYNLVSDKDFLLLLWMCSATLPLKNQSRPVSDIHACSSVNTDICPACIDSVSVSSSHSAPPGASAKGLCLKRPD